MLGLDVTQVDMSSPLPIADRRRSLEYVPVMSDSSSEFRVRRDEYRFSNLAQHWSECSECGGHHLLHPSRSQRILIPESVGVCGDCESAFMLGSDNLPHLLHVRASNLASRLH